MTRAALIGLRDFDGLERAAEVLLASGAQVVLYDVGDIYDEVPLDEKLTAAVDTLRQFGDLFVFVDRIDAATVRSVLLAKEGSEALLLHASGLLGAVDLVVLGKLPGFPLGPVGPEMLAALARRRAELVVVGSSLTNLDNIARPLLAWSAEPAAEGVAISLLGTAVTASWNSPPDAGSGARWPVTPTAQLLAAQGVGVPVHLDELDHWAAERRRTGGDALAGRFWWTAVDLDIGSRACLVADAPAGPLRPELSTWWELPDDDRPFVDLRPHGIEGIIVPVGNDICGGDITGEWDDPDGIRVGMGCDAFDGDGDYELVMGIRCSSGRLIFGGPTEALNGDGWEVEVRPGSEWIVELHANDDSVGVRLRPADGPAADDG